VKRQCIPLDRTCAQRVSRNDLDDAMMRIALYESVRLLALLLAIACACTARAASPSRIAGPSPASTDIDWQISPLDLDLRGMNGERYAFRCPPGKPLPSRVSGSGPYTDDSSICTAAVHAGAISAKDGGEVTIEIRPGEARYPSSERNYIRSAAYDRAWSGSFVVQRNGTTPMP
jgi:hypothetical protein